MAVKPPVIEAPSESKTVEVPQEFVNFEVEDGFKLVTPPSMPAFPAKTIRADKDRLFFDWIASLTENDWTHLQCYLYREWPVIDRKQVKPDNSTNIDKLVRGFDKEFIKREHGSGRYMFMVNDVNKAVKGKGGQVGTAHTDIDDPEFPPKFILEELVVDHPSNRRVRDKLIAEGKLSIEGRPTMTTQGGGTDNAALIGLIQSLLTKVTTQPQKNDTMDNVTSMFTKTHETAMNMLKDQVKSDDPDKLVKMLAALKEMMPKPEGNNSIELIMKMQADNAKVQAESQTAREALMLKMMEMMNQKREETDTFDMQLDRMIKMKEFMGEGFGGGGGKKNTLETVLEYGAPVAIKVLETVQGFINIRNYAEGLKRQGAQPQATPDMPPPSLQPPPEQNPKGDNVVEMPQQNQIPMTALIRGPVGQMIIDALKAGTPGDEFAHSVETLHTKLVYDQIASLGKDQLLNSMKAVPEFWNQVAPSIEKFVDEFIAYGTEGPEGEE